MMERVLQALGAVTEADLRGLNQEVPFKDLEGWDSMRAVNFQMELEQEFGVDLSNDQITGSSNLADIVAILSAHNVPA